VLVLLMGVVYEATSEMASDVMKDTPNFFGHQSRHSNNIKFKTII
jgi:hypothetical protein